MFSPVLFPLFSFPLSPQRASDIRRKKKNPQQQITALDDKGGAYTWGNGGYGRLGHTVQKDEHAPRQVAQLTGRTPCALDSPCAAGATSSLCVMAGGQLMAWGKLKVSGENS